MGTALYVSPEQATGSPLTGSSDIYSLGVVAYECLSGEPPFMADQPLAIAIMHKHDPVPPLPPDVPRPVADLVYAMLAKTPDGRPETAQHVADRAEVIREARSRSGLRPGRSPPTCRWCRTFRPPDGNDFYNDGNDFYNGEPAWSPDPRPRRRALLFAGPAWRPAGSSRSSCSCSLAAQPRRRRCRRKDGHTTSPGQSASEAATPTTASLPASTAGGYATGTNLGDGIEDPYRDPFGQPYDRARDSLRRQRSHRRQRARPPPRRRQRSSPPAPAGDKQRRDVATVATDVDADADNSATGTARWPATAQGDDTSMQGGLEECET